MLGWMVAAAYATPGLSGAAHIGATPVEAAAWAGGGGGAAWLGSDGVGGVVLETGAKLGERGAMNVLVGSEIHAYGVPVTVSGRWLLRDRDDLRLAATLQTAVTPLRLEEVVDTRTSPGLALDAGGEKVRFDVAVPIWGVTSWGRYVGPARFAFPLGATMGVDFLVGERQRLRIGAPEIFSWHLQTEKVYVDVGGITIGVAGAMWAKVGAIF